MKNIENYIPFPIGMLQIFGPPSALFSIGVGIGSNALGLSYTKISLTIVLGLTVGTLFGFAMVKRHYKQKLSDGYVFIYALMGGYFPLVIIGYTLGMGGYYLGKFGLTTILPNYYQWIKS